MKRSFQDVLTDLHDGQVHEQLTETLAEVVQAVMKAKKAGALTLTLHVKTEGGSQAIIKADIKTRLPRPATEATPFYTLKDGGLTREDPRQLNLRSVKNQAEGALRDVGKKADAPAPVKE
jgi:uncharacterized protein (DUF849 family)